MGRMIQYIVIDVDGTMTDAGIYYDENGNELKKFCTRDAAGLFAAHESGIKTVVLTGRKCEATRRRMMEMKVDHLFQNVGNKVEFLNVFMKEKNIHKNEIAYIGDDLNDLPAMELVGFVGCPSDSCREVQARADYISPVKGGYGVVRDVMEHILRESGEWEKIISKVYGVGV